MSEHTQIGMRPTRLSPQGRPRLRRLADTALRICNENGAPRLARICDALLLALLDIEVLEFRVSNTERDLLLARDRIADLEARVRSEFDEPTVQRDVRSVDPLLSICRDDGAPR